MQSESFDLHVSKTANLQNKVCEYVFANKKWDTTEAWMSSGKLRVCVFVCLGTGGAGSPGKYQTSRAVLVSAYTCVHPRISSQKSLQSNET